MQDAITTPFEGTQAVLTLRSSTDPGSGLHVHLDWSPPLSNFPDPENMPISHKSMASIFASTLLPMLEQAQSESPNTVN